MLSMFLVLKLKDLAFVGTRVYARAADKGGSRFRRGIVGGKQDQEH